MTIRPILLHPDPRLKKRCAEVTVFDDTLRLLAEDMLETMYDAPGIGLAAPQIGKLLRVITLDCVKEEDAPRQPMVLVNPEILWTSEETREYEEGCLSIPEHYGLVTRPAEVKAAWIDVDGNPHEAKFDGLWATCVQHEIDHLNGRLFLDYLGPIRRQTITRKMQKYKREIARA